jgi:hypothetical protein
VIRSRTTLARSSASSGSRWRWARSTRTRSPANPGATLTSPARVAGSIGWPASTSRSSQAYAIRSHAGRGSVGPFLLSGRDGGGVLVGRAGPPGAAGRAGRAAAVGWRLRFRVSRGHPRVARRRPGKRAIARLLRRLGRRGYGGLPRRGRPRLGRQYWCSRIFEVEEFLLQGPAEVCLAGTALSCRRALREVGEAVGTSSSGMVIRAVDVGSPAR